jgi:hypothetical protein
VAWIATSLLDRRIPGLPSLRTVGGNGPGWPRCLAGAPTVERRHCHEDPAMQRVTIGLITRRSRVQSRPARPEITLHAPRAGKIRLHAVSACRPPRASTAPSMVRLCEGQVFAALAVAPLPADALAVGDLLGDFSLVWGRRCRLGVAARRRVRVCPGGRAPGCRGRRGSEWSTA